MSRHGRLRLRDSRRNTQTQLAPALVEQVDGERVEGDEAPDQLRDLLQQLVEVENGGDLAAKIEEGRDELMFADAGGRPDGASPSVRCRAH